jgi:hypothetical protein
MKSLTISTLILLLSVGCASRPEPGSLAAVHDQAQQQAIEACLKTNFRKYPNVRTVDVWDGCHKAILRQPQLIQRVGN